MAITQAFPGSPLTVDSVALRKDIAGLVARDSTGVPRAGVFPRSAASIVTGRTDMTVNVTAFEGVSVRGGGALFLANDGTVVVPVAAAPPGNARLDSVIFRQREDGYAGFSDGANAPIIEVIAGQASATPQKPSLTAYPGAVELATILVTANATATNTLTITQTAKFTAASGGIVVVRNPTDLSEWTPVDGSEAYDLSTKLTSRRVSGAWETASTGSISYGTLYKNSATYKEPVLEKLGKRVRFFGTFTNLPATFAANTSYTFGTIPSGFRPARSVLNPCAVSPLQTGFIRVNPDGSATFAMSIAGTLGDSVLAVGFDFSWDTA